jgi:hypothetical protein
MRAPSAHPRTAAAFVAAALVLAAVPAAPAAAGPRQPVAGFGVMWTRATYPYERVPGYYGGSPEQPADAGSAPGAVTWDVHVQNGGEPLRDVVVAPHVVANGHVDSISCSTTPLPDDVVVPRDTTQPAARRAPVRTSAAAAEPTWSDPDLVLPAGEHLYCAVAVSGITDKALSQVVTTTTGVGVRSGWSLIEDDGGVWAAAGALRVPAPPAAQLGGRVWLDRNDDGYARWDTPSDPDLAEPAFAGLRVTVAGPDGKPVPTYPPGQGVLGALTTDADGGYRFERVRPYTNAYTVSLDLRSPALKGLVKSRRAPGTVSADGSTWSQKINVWAGDEVGVNFRLVRKDRLGLTTRAAWTTIAGAPMTVRGRAERADTGAWDGPMVLETKIGGTSTWTKVVDTVSREGAMAVTVRPVRDASFRFRSPGDRDTPAAVSPEFHTLVYRAPSAIRVGAPASVRQGETLTVTGTLTRSGRPFATGRVVLQYRPDGADEQTTLATLRSTADGTLSATVKAPKEGWYRLHYLGDSKTYENWDSTYVAVSG